MIKFLTRMFPRAMASFKHWLALPGTLTDVDLEIAMRRREIVIADFVPKFMGSASYTYRLGCQILVPKPGYYNPMDTENGAQEYETIPLEQLTRDGMEPDAWKALYLSEARLEGTNIDANRVLASAMGKDGLCRGYPFLPNDFALGATLEGISIVGNYKVKVDGKSTNARYGLTFHQTAMNVWPGHGIDSPTTVTLELKNVGQHWIILHYGMVAGNFVWERTVSPTSKLYGRVGRYRDQGQMPGAPIDCAGDVVLPPRKNS